MSTMRTGPARYWLGTGAAEVDHLIAQAEIFAPQANELLDRLELAAGGSAIDVGCGVLGILPQLRERVGAAGRVVGLDLEPRMLALAAELAAERGIEVETVAADATATGLRSASFDLVHARTLLINVTDPEAIVAELTRLARPGGTVAVQEPDAASWVCDPPHPAFDRLRDRLIAVYPRVGKDFLLGRRTARLLRGAGLREVQARAVARVTRPGDYYQTFLLALCGLLRDPLLAGGGIAALPYTTAVLQEAMRIYPPAWGIGRRTPTGDVLGGHPIPVGSDVLVSPWVTHRHPEFWPEPARFDPERFMGDGERHRYAWLPFGGGPRACIGQHFSMLEATLVLAAAVRAFKFTRVTDAPVRLMPPHHAAPRRRGPLPARAGVISAPPATGRTAARDRS
jgi:SAM-dependent methyltransferase